MRISVIVCTYNRARFLRLCGESWTALKRLAGAEAEFLIVDNNSDDDTAAASRALVTAIKAKPGWTASYHFEPVQGLSAARNRGVAEAAGDWVAFLDDECLTPADWLLRLEEEIRAQAPDAIGGPYRGRFTPDGAYPPSFLERYGDSHHLRDGWEARWLSKPGLSGGNIAVRRALLREAGGFDPALGMNGAVIAFGEESELQTRLLARGAKLYFSPRLELVHFIRPEKSDLNAGLTAARRRARANAQIQQRRAAESGEDGWSRRARLAGVAARRGAVLSGDLIWGAAVAAAHGRPIATPLRDALHDGALQNTLQAAYGAVCRRDAAAKDEVERSGPLCTLVIPAYNAEHFLEATLESVRAQSLRNFICVIVNDGSTDGTQALAARLARRDPRFRVIRHHANSGLSAARNTGLRAAATPYVAFLDADDLLMRNALEIRIAALEADPEEPEVIGAYCASAAIPEGRTQPPLPTARTLPELSFLSVAGDCPFNANQPLFIAEKLRRLGGFNERFAQAEDYEFWARLFRAGYKMRPAHHVAVTYRRRPSSMIRTAPLAHLDIALALNESAHAPLPDWVDFDSDAAPYRQPHGAYRAAMDTARRSLSFAAMEATREVESEPEIKAPSLGLRRRLRETAPLARRLLGEAQARDGALSGVARFYAEPRTGVEERRPAASAAALALLDELDPRQEPPMAAEASAFPLTDRAQFYGWARDDQRAAEILFLPQKDYHLRAIAEIAPFLRAQGVRFEIIDLSSHCGDRGLRGAAAEAGFTLIGLSAFLLGDYRPSLLVAFNEWDPSVRGIFGAAQAAGLRTAAIVEGIQDYRDADIPRRRDAYRMADCVVLPGAFDRRYFSDSAQTVVVGGVPRIDLLRAEPRRAPPDRPLALINANFTYGVLTEHRDAWLEQAAAACDAAGVDWAISRHPADLGALFPERVVSESFYEATARASVVIQRFASGVLEALAMGKPVIYFNPHGERVDKFKEPMGAYPIVETTAALEAELTEIETLTARGEPAWPAFLDAHCAAEGGRGAAETTAAHLIRWRDEADAAGRADWALWRRNLRAVDQFSSALFETHKVLNAVPARYRFGAAPPQPGALDETFAPRLMAKRDAANVLSADLRRATGRFEHALHLVDERIATFYQKSKHWPLIGPALIAVAPLYDRAMGKKKR